MADPDGRAIVEKIKQAGLVGGGGAGFPTHIKAASDVEVVIGNGAECEPLLNCDKALMISDPRAVVKGLRLLARAAGGRRLVLAVKEKNRDVVRALEDAAAGTKGEIEVYPLGDFYPSGDEVTLVYEVTGRIVPEGGIPPDVGVLVQNVATLVKIAEAVEGRPFTRRLVTVAGEVRDPVTLDAPLGTPLQDLIEAAGGPLIDRFSVILGGPCMGGIASSLDDPVVKTTTGILVLPEDHPLVVIKSASIDQLLHRARSTCDQCQDCTELCPRYLLGHNLSPRHLMTAIGWGNDLTAPELRTAHLCCECGICGLYACPTGLHPNLYIHRIKAELNAAGLPRERGATPERPREEYAWRKLPLGRLKVRLGLSDYPDRAPLREAPLKPRSVRIPLLQHLGAPCRAVVKAGQTLKEGDLVGEVPDGALGARIHASISGRVTEVNEKWVKIAAAGATRT